VVEEVGKDVLSVDDIPTKLTVVGRVRLHSEVSDVRRVLFAQIPRIEDVVEEKTIDSTAERRTDESGSIEKDIRVENLARDEVVFVNVIGNTPSLWPVIVSDIPGC
jgi:hypothetical protein